MSRADSQGPKADGNDQDRRVATRHFACFPASIEAAGAGKCTAVIWDLSVTGTLLVTNAVLNVGDSVTLSLFLALESPVEAVGRVVRFEALPYDPREMWPYRAAIQFDTPMTKHEAAIRELAERQEELGLHKT